MINGVALPETQPIAVAAGNRVLLRYVNGGALHHPWASQYDPRCRHRRQPAPECLPVVAETVAPGSSIDAIATVPANAPERALPCMPAI
ncbi:MAG: hypothetical protein H6643_14640 [Caldilineaceae bacterium]|nr:hypothetical protein [Caldilineaceae bacterium]